MEQILNQITAPNVIVFIIGVVIGLVPKLLSIIKAIASKGETISLKLSTAFVDTAETFKEVNEAIANDDKIDAQELQQVLAQGKKAVVAYKDVIVSLKPL